MEQRWYTDLRFPVALMSVGLAMLGPSIPEAQQIIGYLSGVTGGYVLFGDPRPFAKTKKPPDLPA